MGAVLAGLAARLVPRTVRACETRADRPDAVLHPQEQVAVARAVPGRRAEYATVRWCARQALAALGVPTRSIPRGEGGAPRWPDGVVGSMTHCAGYRGAVVARSADVTALGLDAEPHQPLPLDVLDMVAVEDELRMLARLAVERPDVHGDRLLFSAKESVYKAWYPLTGRWLDFADVTVVLDPDGRFAARLPTDGSTRAGRPLTGFTGRWIVAERLLLTAVCVDPAAG